MKRFYNLVSIEKVDNGYHILLDNRPVKTKLKAFLCAPNEAIASRISCEWANQGEEIIPDTMPFMQILTTQIDRVSKERDVMSATILSYLNTDLLCYMADAPEALVQLQQEKWQIWLDWFEEKFGCKLKTTTSLNALTQDNIAHKAVTDYVGALDDEHFTILQIVTSISGSLILGLALLKGAVNADQILEACFLEEIFKETLYDSDKYGSDPILEKSQKSALKDLTAAQDYLSLL